VETAPGVVRVRGYPIEELVGEIGWAALVWLVLRGELPRPWEEKLLEAALVAGVDHGPMAPSIAIARMVATCGTSLGAAVAAGLCAIGDIHGGAAEQCMELFYQVAERERQGADRGQAVEEVLGLHADGRVPGYGHRVHRRLDPRAVRLGALVEDASRAGRVSGRFLEIAREVEANLERRKGRRVPMNVDGAVAVVLCELGFSPVVGRAVFILSRCVGIVAHALEQASQGERLKGPVPPHVGYVYEGPALRHVPRRPGDG
jgi:citrate synthase